MDKIGASPSPPGITTCRLPYTYRPLQHPDSIRILKLLPGKEDDRLLCTLQECRIQNTIYQALSYAWGKPGFTRRMNEIDSGTYIRLTANLYHALMKMRLRSEIRYVWIDAICIDQSSLSERNHQVKNMAEIYRQASEVLVWLGRAPCDRVVRGFKSITTALADERTPRKRFSDEGEIEDAMMADSARRRVRSHIRLCDAVRLADFFARAWFTRVWVVQEFLLAVNVTFFVGDRTMSLYTFEQSLNALLEHENVLTPNLNTSRNQALWDRYLRGIGAARELVRGRSTILAQERRTSRSLYQCCRMLFERFCSDDRDKIYAALGLARNSLGIVPDYNLSLDEIRIDFATRSLLAGDFSVLHHADKSWLGASADYQLPSFVPSLKVDNYIDMAPPLGGFDSPTYSAGLSRKPYVYLPPDKLTVRLRGVRVDTICHAQSFASIITDLPVGRGSPFKSQLHETYERLDSIYIDTLSKFGSEYSRYASIKLAFWRTIHLGLCPRRNEAQYITRTDFRFLDLADRTNITKSLTNRVFFSTDLGFIGLGPPWLQEKDNIVVFDGAETPFVLRSVSNEAGGETWKVIGDCYLEGWMDGKYFGLQIMDDAAGSCANSASQTIRAGNMSSRSSSVTGSVLKSELFTLC